jgi:steroid-22-oyl-CoA synthetase
METFARLLLGRAADDHTGLLFEDERYSWAEVVRAAEIRAELTLAFTDVWRAGTRPPHVGVLLENVPEYVFWIGAAALAGAALAGINPTRRGAALAADIRHTDCDLIVTDARHAELLEGLDTGVPPERTLLVGEPRYEAALAPLLATRRRPVPVRPGDRLLLLFTSGSTGAPKAVPRRPARSARAPGSGRPAPCSTPTRRSVRSSG